MTLHERLHAALHVGARSSWRCQGDLGKCRLRSTVELIAGRVAEWLDDEAEELASAGGDLDPFTAVYGYLRGMGARARRGE